MVATLRRDRPPRFVDKTPPAPKGLARIILLGADGPLGDISIQRYPMGDTERLDTTNTVMYLGIGTERVENLGAYIANLVRWARTDKKEEVLLKGLATGKRVQTFCAQWYLMKSEQRKLQEVLANVA